MGRIDPRSSSEVWLVQESVTTICLPVFNEAEGIGPFLLEIEECFQGSGELNLVVVNDNSTDETRQILESLTLSRAKLTILENQVNLGHGPSLLKGLAHALELRSDFIVSCDGDGQISGQDLRMLLHTTQNGDCSIVEGIRVGRRDPWFRRFISVSTRLLVLLRSGSMPRDANTPFRCYRGTTLASLLDKVNSASLIPNLDISVATRRAQVNLRQVEIASRLRRGASAVGTMWGSGSKMLPSRKLVKFCKDALRQWWTRR